MIRLSQDRVMSPEGQDTIMIISGCKLNTKLSTIPAMVIILALLIGCGLKNTLLGNNIYLYDLSDIGSGSPKMDGQVRKMMAGIDNKRSYPELDILTPYDGTVFPRDMASPQFIWRDPYSNIAKWLLMIGFKDTPNMIYVLTDKNTWIPDRHYWEIIKAHSIEKEAKVTIIGMNGQKSFEIASRSSIVISTSKDELGAPIFYKQVPPHFSFAYNHPELSKWRLGDVSSYEEPRIVMERLPVCGNCHSFSSDGKVFGMDIDHKNDKGAYVLTRTGKNMELSGGNFITWNDFQKPEDSINMGLFSRISPDGNYVVSTIHEKNFMVLMNDLNFSQLFLTAKGVLAVYSRADDKFMSLSGADDPYYVQTNPAWSPDGKCIVFSRAKVSKELMQLINNPQPSEISPDIRIEDLNKKYQIQYELYRVPFNEGRGGPPEPIKGASNNNMSTYCARYSPDGKWIVFNQSKTGLLLQPDSQLYIIPAEGGTARKMSCNLDIMNSWHSWSPNSRWLVFASKMNSPFTELFLTHIDKDGNDSPPVLLWRLNSKEYAATIPEFINLKKESIRSIKLLSF